MVNSLCPDPSGCSKWQSRYNWTADFAFHSIPILYLSIDPWHWATPDICLWYSETSHHPEDLKNEERDYLWPREISRKFLGMEPDTWRSIRQNEGVFTASRVPRRRKPKQLIPVRESNGKFKQASDTQIGREIQASTRYE